MPRVGAREGKGPVSRSILWPGANLCFAFGVIVALLPACGEGGPDPLTPPEPPDSIEPELPSTSILPAALDSVLTARLSKRWESKHFIFHFESSDDTCCEAMRMEAFHKWAVSYLDITVPKKIDYFKFKTGDDLEAALSREPLRKWGAARPTCAEVP